MTNQPKSRMEEVANEMVKKFRQDASSMISVENGMEWLYTSPVFVENFLRSSLRSLIETYDRETEVHYKDSRCDCQDESVCSCNRDAQSAARAKWKGEGEEV